MERAGNGDTDPDAERRGLGTPATRAAVIEKLVKGGFAERKGEAAYPYQKREQPYLYSAGYTHFPTALPQNGKTI